MIKTDSSTQYYALQTMHYNNSDGNDTYRVSARDPLQMEDFQDGTTLVFTSVQKMIPG